jgi:cation:H+ antiporter
MNTITLLQLIGGLALLVAGGELLVKGASRFAAAIGISPLVIGLTVVAFGTSAPELIVSSFAAINGHPEVAIGNVFGSNAFNIGFVLGASALIAPLAVNLQVVQREVPVMIAASIACWALAVDGRLDRIECTVLFSSLILYVIWTVHSSRRASQRAAEEFAREFGARPNERNTRQLLFDIVLILCGLVLLSFGADQLVAGAVAIAKVLGIDERTIGLTIVACGTSLPEVATSLTASLRGERDIAVGNVVGSNIFNILAVLGFSGMLVSTGLPLGPDALSLDIPVMVLLALACLPIFLGGMEINRFEGVSLLLYFFAYLTYIVLSARAPQPNEFRLALLLIPLPLGLFTLFLAKRAKPVPPTPAGKDA